MSMNRQYITDWSLHLNPVESMEVLNDPGFEELGSIAFRFLHHRRIAEIPIDEEDPLVVIQDGGSTCLSEFLDLKLSLLCSDDDDQQLTTDYEVQTILESLEVHPLLIDRVKPQIVSKAIQMAIDTKNRGLRQFGLTADIEVITLTEVVPEMDEDPDLTEENLRRVLLQSMTMRQMNLRPNPASKSSIDKLKRGFFESSGGVGDDELGMGGMNKKNNNCCAVCLDDFEIGSSEVIWMPCSHIFHQGCLLGWLEEHKSCPLCRLELPD